MYEKFKQLNGNHPWRNVSPDGYVDYHVRYRPQGRVLYVNFPLAQELGLLPANHPTTLNKELEATILETFSLVIINEYDLKEGKKFPPDQVRPTPVSYTHLRAHETPEHLV